MNTCRLIYRSISEERMFQSEFLSRLENQAANNNRRLGIYGILVASQGRFLQLLEGPSKLVNQIFIKITHDKRHHDIELISYEEIVKPIFIDWSMRILNLDHVSSDVRTLLEKKYPLSENQVQFPENEFLVKSFLVDIRNVLNS